MEKHLKDFISIWNYNIHLVDYSSFGGKTHQSLLDFCIDDFLKKYKSINLKQFILYINKNNNIHKEIKSVDSFIEALHFEYHFKNFKSKNKKYVYLGTESNQYDIKTERIIKIDQGKISPLRPTQKDIDTKIIETFMIMDDFSFVINGKTPYEFLFYQLSLYNFSTIKVKKIYNLSIELNLFQKDLERHQFLQNLYSFLKKYRLETIEIKNLIFGLNI